MSKSLADGSVLTRVASKSTIPFGDAYFTNKVSGSYKSQNTFITHLKSPAHSDEKYQCLKCLRIYDSLTALTQHSESQGVRCNVRETDDFESVIRAITADTTTTNGRMADDTIRYEINPDAELSKTKMTENYRAAEREKNEARKRYWDNREIKW